MKPGYIYVLVHPSNPKLYKIGITTRNPEKRLKEHNSDFSQYTGRIVKESGQLWVLKEYHGVRDTSWAEVSFWASTGLDVIPYRDGIEVEELDWHTVEKGIAAARSAGVRPPDPVPDYIFANNTWMRKRLEGRNITLLSNIRSKFGKANFKCSVGHEWRTVPNQVADGSGCPVCGIGIKPLDEIILDVKPANVYLLTSPDHPGMIKIQIQLCGSEEDTTNSWNPHRFRYTEDVELAETVIWRLLGREAPFDESPFEYDLQAAEDAFRKFTYEMHSELAVKEKGGY